MRFINYEWDETKREENLRKHGVDFADAIGALEYPMGLTRDDPAAVGEARFVTLDRGYSDRILYVVRPERGELYARIISACRASPGEARQYED